MSKFLRFLTSRGFAILLLCSSIVLLLIWNSHPDFYSPLFTIIPVFVFVSISLCIARRSLAGSVRVRKYWGSVIFHIGLLIIVAVVSLSPFTRFLATAVLPQGVTASLVDEKFVSIHSVPAFGEIPFMFLRLNWHEIAYKDGKFPVDYAAGLQIGLMEGAVYKTSDEVIKVNSPVRMNGYDFLLEHGSQSPLFIVAGEDGKIIFNQFVRVSNETGVVDTFEIPGAGIVLYTRFFPDMFSEGGKYGTRSRELKNPAFGIKASTKDDPLHDIWRGVLKRGEKAEFNGLTLEFADLRPVITVQITKDPTYWGVFAGWLVIIAGLLLRYAPMPDWKRNNGKVRV